MGVYMENELVLKNRLKEIRTEHGYSQAKLAEMDSEEEEKKQED